MNGKSHDILRDSRIAAHRIPFWELNSTIRARLPDTHFLRS
jgi:hypothetical protein